MKITLPRSGDRPLQFDGEKIAAASSRLTRGQEANRWHDLELYQATDGIYVLSIAYQTQWQGELDHFAVYCSETAADVATILQTTDPAEFVRGFPPYPQFQARQASLFADIRARYDQAVSDLLADLPEELGETKVEDIQFEEG